ncbi:AraC family transcriptional regulator [Aquisalimonas lutea]|uniref:AraC family ligand binding domain-containing protein n=1 Tax=Aquisalimonas lutea TaxID=1327750 RepID=UPI0025B57151|nr:AraC family transcriptional regulator [Aquisalimonas lutea]MDN3517582.1 AraC family transcriptional regulator [Aquisalimonas lutea]
MNPGGATPEHANPPERGVTAHLRIFPGLDHLEWLHARFVDGQRYARHCHATYAIGVVESGIEGFHYRGARHAAGAGRIVVINPQEPHDGFPVGGHFRYRMIYPTVDLLRRAAGTTGPGTPHFPSGVIHDPGLARALVRAHERLEQGTTLEGESAFYTAVQQLVQRHAHSPRTSPSRGNGVPAGLRQTRDYLEANLGEGVSLGELSRIAGLPPHTLCRAFRQTYGLPPHAYQVNRRVEQARARLASQEPIAAVALALGFTDQAHLNRCFRARTGVTPGQYQRACKNVQDPGAG